MIKLAGKKACKAFFEQDWIREQKTSQQTPFVVFSEKKGQTTIDIIDDVKDLLSYPGRTKVMAQWRGKDRSDYFQFCVGEMRKQLYFINKEQK